MVSNGWTAIARRYLERRHATLWSDFLLSDRLRFEEAVVWLAEVLREALKPEDPMCDDETDADQEATTQS